MVKVADLYIRVSTDEQADKGYSQRDQEERLRKYCEVNGITIRMVIYEDHSAKTFKRPEWTELLTNLRKKRGQVNLILFTKWDRFSRNAGDAYQMISSLRHLGVEPQAVEQPLDLTVPENKMMLAFYLAAPEVENDRRALNVFNGMRRAKKEGRWMATAPIGYVNKTSETGKKYIAPKEVVSGIIKWAFEELSRGELNTDQVWKLAKRKGLSCGRNHFRVIIRNPVYCGKIFIPKHKDEDSMLVDGQHEPLISKALFYKVQDVLDGRKRVSKRKVVVDDNIVLRGHIICPKCGRMLTGSASKGRTNYYHYYHCSSSCGVRYKANEVNKTMIEEIRKYSWNLPELKLYKEVIISMFKSKTYLEGRDKEKLKAQLERANDRLKKARDLLLLGDIDSDDYRIIKSECTEIIDRSEAKLNDTMTTEDSQLHLWEKAFVNLADLDKLYLNSASAQKRRIVGSMFPENLTFEENNFRTNRVNEAIQIISLIDSRLKRKKNGQIQKNLDLTMGVVPHGLEPWTP